ncbi:MAG: hypothetical protein P8175_00760 [Deltaproteobacteria bacterium]|jgi:hypothetical protein
MLSSAAPVELRRPGIAFRSALPDQDVYMNKNLCYGRKHIHFRYEGQYPYPFFNLRAGLYPEIAERY